MEYKHTSRGFGLWTFQDRYGQPCSLQDSSIATEDCIWLGVDIRTDLNTGDPLPDSQNFRMHLTREQAAALIPKLQYFVEHGVIPRTEDKGPEE